MQAVLILAHKNFEHVAFLALKLKQKFAVYIHFDTKMALASANKQFLDQNGIHYISQINVHWGGWSVGEAARRLIKLALQDPDISYVHIISGQDWPIANVDALYEFYENNQHIYLTYVDAGTADNNAAIAEESLIWWQRYYFNYDSINRRTFFGKIYHRAILFSQRLLRINKFKRLNIDLTVFHGANWMNLPRDSASFCLQYLDEHPNFVRMLETGCFSDEFWVQTILCNAPQFKDRLVNNNHRFVKWEKQHNSRPAVLDDRDYQAIVAAEAHFARKFDPAFSQTLIQKLDDHYAN